MSSFLTNLLEVGLRVSVVIVLVALLRPWLRRRIGSRGVALLWCVIAMRLLWPGLLESRWGLIPATSDRLAAEVPSVAAESIVGVTASQTAPLLAEPPINTPRLIAPRSVVSTSAPVTFKAPSSFEWMAGLWAIGVCVVAIYFFRHLLAVRSWAARTEPADAYPPLVIAFAELPARVRGNLEIRVTRELDTPVLAGWQQPQIWIPAAWIDRLSREELRHILWHEIGHARRYDLPVQWLFAATCCLHWFNPLLWLLARWARDERELACDAWVCSQQVKRVDFTLEYGRTLLRLVKGLRRHQAWPLAPATIAMASNFNHLRQRVREIANFRPMPAWRGSLTALVGALALLATTSCQKQSQATTSTVSSAAETTAPSTTTVSAPVPTQAGVITGRVVAKETGEALANVLVRAAVGNDMRFNRFAGSGCLETRSDQNGNYQLSVPLKAGSQTVKLDALTPGYRSSAGTLASGGDWASVTLAPGGTGKYEFKLSKGLYLEGIVVNEAGQPVPNAKIETTFTYTDGGYGYISETRTDANGQFEVFDFPPKPEKGWNKGSLSVRHTDYISSRIENVYSLGKEDPSRLKLVLASGKQITGTLLDANGKPAAAVEIIADGPEPKKNVTDINGKFVLRGLAANTVYIVTAHALLLKEKYQAKMITDKDHDGLTLNLAPIVLKVPLKPINVLGMQMVDLTDELRADYDYESDMRGALLLDPGKDSGRLPIGEIKEGQVFWLVQDIDYKQTAKVVSVRQLVDALVKDLRRSEDGTFTCRVVYTLNPWSTNTQYLRVTEQEQQDLKALAAKLDAESMPDTANTSQSRPPVPIVRAINIKYIGPKTVPSSIISSAMQTAVGQPYSASTVEQDVRNLFATGYFANLKIKDEPVADGVKVNVFVEPKPFLKKLVINGVRQIEISKVRQVVDPKIGETLSYQQISTDCDKIKSLYLSQGYSQMQIKYSIDTNDELGSSEVTFNISEGPRTASNATRSYLE